MFRKRSVLLFFHLVIIYFISGITVYGQIVSGNKDSLPALSLDKYKINSSSVDTLANSLQRGENGLIVFNQKWAPLKFNVSFKDTMFFNSAYLPIVFDGKILPDDLNFVKEDHKPSLFHLISPDSTFVPLLKKRDFVKSLRSSYVTNPENFDKVQYSVKELSSVTPIEDIKHNRSPFQDLITTEDPVSVSLPTIERQKPKAIYWLVKGEHSFQVAQNHISDNWYKGGNSSYYIKSYQKFIFNFKKDKITFDNLLEWKLGLQNSSGDTLRSVNINDDLFRTYSVLGYKAFDKWSYSTTLEIKTQLFNMYPENKKTKTAALMSPLDINAGIGMSYNLNKSYKDRITKKLKFTLNLSPLSVNFRYIHDDEVDVTKFKLEKGHKTKTDLGSLVNSELAFNFNSFVVWNSRFKYFTDYESVTAEFENKLDLSINRYFSTTLSLYLRYDEGSKKDEKLKYFQYNELLSFGLNYKW